MGEVVALDAHRPQWAGVAHCLDCKHEWAAVAPRGTRWVECPACGGGRACGKFPAIPDVYYVCGCGNAQFYLMPDGYLRCPCCGERVDPAA